MPRVTLILALLLGALSPAVSAFTAGPVQASGDVPKTIIVGFDGMDHGLTSRFMDEGLLPNLKKLSESGLFQRLETTNPAQSPVSWAVFNTGQNPGKTGVGGFVSRFFARDKNGKKVTDPLPQPMLGFSSDIEANEFVRLGMAMEDPGKFCGMVAGGALLALLVMFKLFKAPTWLAAMLGLAGGTGGWFLALEYTAGLPANGMVPYEINPMQGTNFWTYLDEAGVRLTGIQIASTFPPDEEGPQTRLLSGLGVKDISGSPGSWFVYTDDPWSWEKETSTAGKIRKIYLDENDGTRARAELIGPNDWIAESSFEARIAALEAQETNPDNSTDELASHSEELESVKADYNKFRKDRAVKVPFVVDADRAVGEVTITVDGAETTLKVGEWSGFMSVRFPFNARFSAHGVVRFHLLRCDDEDVRIFVPPINIDPRHPPEWLPISAPPEFSATIAEGIGGAYETLGWACMTNPLKDRTDSMFEAQAFMDDIAATMGLREQILSWGLSDKDSWDVYYQVFSVTDRVAHLLYREFDPIHPLHDKEYAATMVTAWGRSFPLSRAVPEVYREADRIVGDIMERVDSGEFGDDVLLMLVADHGFTSFRRGVNLNNLMYELGYLKTKDDVPLADASPRDLLRFVDWERTQAYSMGLGKLFINKLGREPKGIVREDQYDALVASIQRDLLAVTDGEGGPKVITSVSRRDELFDGPWWEEGSGERRKRGQVVSVEHDGFADLFLGYEPFFRVSWSNTLGGLDSEAIVDNTNHWSGGHVSVDPIHVPGIFFSNRRFSQTSTAGLIDIGPTVVARYGIEPATTDMDGKVLPFVDLEQ
jgi:predicted AlkP superfamily phosphohydrolase/phosphomutase